MKNNWVGALSIQLFFVSLINRNQLKTRSYANRF